MGVLLLVLGGIWYYVQTSAFMDKVESTASTAASEALGVPVSVGAIKVNSLHDLEIHDLAIYDKQAECIAQADTARVELRLLSAYRDPAYVVKEVTLSNVKETSSSARTAAGTSRTSRRRARVRLILRHGHGGERHGHGVGTGP